MRLAGTGQFAADLNGDGQVDLEIRRESGIIAVLGRGDGSFEERTLLHLFGSFDNVVTTAQGPALVSAAIRWSLVSPSCLAR